MQCPLIPSKLKGTLAHYGTLFAAGEILFIARKIGLWIPALEFSREKNHLLRLNSWLRVRMEFPEAMLQNLSFYRPFPASFSFLFRFSKRRTRDSLKVEIREQFKGWLTNFQNSPICKFCWTQFIELFMGTFNTFNKPLFCLYTEWVNLFTTLALGMLHLIHLRALNTKTLDFA